MKKLLSILAAGLLFPLPAQAVTAVLNDGTSFQIAAIYKLGLADEDTSNQGMKSGPSEGKEVSVDPCAVKDCPPKTPVCVNANGAAKCKCTADSCGAGAICTDDGTCRNCDEGDTCNCPDGKLADGMGACETPDFCSPNPCTGKMPACKSDIRLIDKLNSGYVCGCAGNSCGAGSKCTLPYDALNSVYVANPASAAILVYYCVPCAEGDLTCGCSGDQVADGKGGCHTPVICPQNCEICASSTVCTKCADGYYLENDQCQKKGNCSPGSASLHWNASYLKCTSCDEVTGRCQGSRYEAGSGTQDSACTSGSQCETGWCLPGGTPGRSGKVVQGSHCS